VVLAGIADGQAQRRRDATVPCPFALAGSAAPMISTRSRRRSSVQVGTSTCAVRHALLGRVRRKGRRYYPPSRPRSSRSREPRTPVPDQTSRARHMLADVGPVLAEFEPVHRQEREQGVGRMELDLGGGLVVVRRRDGQRVGGDLHTGYSPFESGCYIRLCGGIWGLRVLTR
jgi:hypothetical protein